ncbi:MAG: ABC transporter substrate-binding subunit SaoX [Pseudomonadota bacterium]
MLKKMSMNTCLTTGLSISLAAILSFAPCAQAKDDYEIVLGYYNCDHMTAAPLAQYSGIYERMGLNVRVIGNAKVPESMAAGHMDAGYVGITRVMRAYMKGAPIVMGANNHLGGSEYFVVNESIKSPADLKGKKLMLGSNPDKLNSNWIMYAMDNDLPLDPKESGIENFSMSDKDAYLAFRAGHLDGFDTCDPWGSMAQYEKTGDILTTFTGLRNAERGTCCILTLNQNFINDHFDLAVTLVQAHAEAIKMEYLKPLEASKIFSKAYYVPEEVGLMTLYMKTVGEGRTMSWEIDDDRVRATRDNCVAIGILTESPKIADFVNHDVINAAQLESFDDFIKNEVDPVFPLGMSYEEWRAKVIERGL